MSFWVFGNTNGHFPPFSHQTTTRLSEKVFNRLIDSENSCSPRLLKYDILTVSNALGESQHMKILMITVILCLNPY